VLALLFPGQGSQEVGMGRDVLLQSRGAADTFLAADRALGFALSDLIFEGSEEDLRRTEIQQPAILTTSIALLRALQEDQLVQPSYVAGHSLGEYTALVASGAMGFEDAVRLVHARGSFMQEAVPEGTGAMAAILGCSAEEVDRVCRLAAEETSQLVTPANFNSPQQTVIAGEGQAVERACALALERGEAKRAVPLLVSAPFHCALMQPAAEKLAPELAQLRLQKMAIPVVTNVEAVANRDETRVPELLKAQVTAPVRFSESIEYLVAQGVTHFLEVGPGRVLTGLVSRIQRRAKRANFGVVEDWSEAKSFIASA